MNKVTPINAAAAGRKSAAASRPSQKTTPPFGIASYEAVLPSESAGDFAEFRTSVLNHLAPKTPDDISGVLDYIDVAWRLRRVAAQEAELIRLECNRISKGAASVPGTEKTLEALAIERLFNQGKALAGLHQLEEMLSRRMLRFEPLLGSLRMKTLHPELHQVTDFGLVA